METASPTRIHIPPGWGTFHVVMNRHVRPSKYEQTDAGIDPADAEQSAAQAFRTFALITADCFPPIYNQAEVPRGRLALPLSHAVSERILEGIRSGKERAWEDTPTDTDLSIEEATELFKKGKHTLVLRYGSDRPRCALTDQETTARLEALMQYAPRRFRGKVAISGYCRDPRLTAANTLDVPADLGIEKLDLLRVWAVSDVNPLLQSYIRDKQNGRTPQDIRDDVSAFIIEKFSKYLSLRKLGMDIVMQLTTHETHLVATSDTVNAPVGFAASSYFGLAPACDKIPYLEVNTPYSNESANLK